MLYVDLPTRADLDDLINKRGKTLVSLYLPTTPVTQQAQADRIVLKNQTAEVVSKLAALNSREVRPIEDLLHDLVDDDEFWEFQANSLAVFVTAEGLRTFRLPNRLQPVVEISDRFFLKPLLRAVTVPQSAFILAIGQNGVRLIEASADLPAHTVKVDNLPDSAAAAAGKASIKDRSPSGRIQGSEGMKVRSAQYARKVDLALRGILSGRETPLILAAAEPMQSIYREVQSYPHLTKSFIPGNPEKTSDADLAAAARGILDELFREELAKVRALFEQRSKEGRASTDVAQTARAASRGAVQTLLIDIDEVIPGVLDDDGAVTFADKPGPESYGIIDEIARRALQSGARVLGVRKADIPGGGSLAAIMRYPF